MYSIETGQSPIAIVDICLVPPAYICPVSAADICPVSTADICPVSAEDVSSRVCVHARRAVPCQIAACQRVRVMSAPVSRVVRASNENLGMVAGVFFFGENDHPWI